MLVVGRNACIISTEEDGLWGVSQLVLWTHSIFQIGLQVRRTYHEPHISRLWRREELIKDFDSMGGCISTVAG